MSTTKIRYEHFNTQKSAGDGCYVSNGRGLPHSADPSANGNQLIPFYLKPPGEGKAIARRKKTRHVMHACCKIELADNATSVGNAEDVQKYKSDGTLLPALKGEEVRLVCSLKSGSWKKRIRICVCVVGYASA